LVIHGGAGTATPEHAAEQRPGARRSLETGWRVLSAGGSALDAVVAAVVVMEDDPTFNAGVGSCLTANGEVEMDASLMDGASLRAGAVALVRRTRRPIELARAVMEEGHHLFFAGEAADAIAARRGLATCEPDELVTAVQRDIWQRRLHTSGGTVGAVAVDRLGHVAAATSTGGMTGKQPGRIGDSAVIGAGTYADDRCGAASSTGEGEAIIRIGMAKLALDQLRGGADPGPAARQAIDQLEQRTGGRGGIILVDAFGRYGAACNTPHMTWGAARAEGLDLF
jgi:beta-aspartyl-peptidase (threonine type)